MQPGQRKVLAAMVIAGSVLAVLCMQYDATAAQGVIAAFGLGVLWGRYVWALRACRDGYVSPDEVLSLMRDHKEG
jgi:hypothetical protein